MSHLSDLSQIYNTNLRLKFGSAPAQLLSKGEQAEKSLEKRVSILKNQFDLSNLVSTKSQLSQHLSKQAMQGTISTMSWAKYDDSSKKSLNNSNASNNFSNKSILNKNNKSKITNSIKYSEVSEDSSDEEYGRPNNNKSEKKNLKSKKNIIEVTSEMSRGDRGLSNRSVSSSNHSIGKYF